MNAVGNPTGGQSISFPAEELRIWEGSDADLMQTESEPAVFDNHAQAGAHRVPPETPPLPGSRYVPSLAAT